MKSLAQGIHPSVPRVTSCYLERKADLHPPLGEGENGPCYVAQRIRQEIRNPFLQKQLVQKVESGEDLSNQEIYKVYAPYVERGFTPETEQLKLVPHAQYRMDMRKVRVPFLRLMFKLFVDWLKAHPDVHAYYEQQWARGEEVSWKEPSSPTPRVRR